MERILPRYGFTYLLSRAPEATADSAQQQFRFPPQKLNQSPNQLPNQSIQAGLVTSCTIGTKRLRVNWGLWLQVHAR